MIEKEIELVNSEFITGKNIYNIALGGFGGATHGFVTVRNDKGETFQTSVNDTKYLNGEYVFISTGFVTVRNDKGETFQTSVNDLNYLNGSLKSIHFNKAVGKNSDGIILYVNREEFTDKKMTGIIKGTICVKDKNNNNIRVKTDDPRLKNGELTHPLINKVVVRDGNKNLILDRSDPRFTSGELCGVTKGTTPVRDINGVCRRVKSDDPRLESGELKHPSIGLKMSDETKLKMSNIHRDTTWIHDQFNSNRKVKTDQLTEWISKGWSLGRIVDKNKMNITDKTREKMGTSSRDKKWINKSDRSIRVDIQEINMYINEGWSLGRF